MRITGALIAVALTVTACGSADSISSGGTASDDTGPTPPTTMTTTTIEPDRASPDGDPDVTTTTDAAASQAYPEDEQDLDPDPSVERLSIEDALLPDEAFAAPWELQWHERERFGYGAGPNQTDCEEYWAYESLLGAGGGHVMWWVDGGNANHYVLRMPDEMSIFTTLIAVGTIADECPVVNWSEGGSFTTEAFDLGDALAMRFVDEGSSEMTWVVVTTHGDLVSLLQVPLWTRADGTMVDLTLDELAQLGTQMLERLQAAGPETSPPSTTTTEPLPIATDPPIIVAPDPPVSGLGQLLLTGSEAPQEWTLTEVAEYNHGQPDEELLAACPSSAALDRIEPALEWEAEFRNASGGRSAQIIGEMADADTARAAVEEFAGMANCDLGVVLGEATVSGGAIDLVEADAAAALYVEASDPEDAHLELIVASIDAIVVVFTSETATDAVRVSLTKVANGGVAKIVEVRG